MKTFIQIFCTISLKISGRATALMDEPPCPNITLMYPVHVFPKNLFQSNVSSTPCTHTYFLHHTYHTLSSSHTDFMTLDICKEYAACIYSLCSFLHPLVTSTLSGPNILLSTLFLKYFQPMFSF